MPIIDNSNKERQSFLKVVDVALKATCQLYQWKDGISDNFIANGCSILFQFNSSYYLFSNAHVLADNMLGETFLLLKDNMSATLGGQIYFTRMPATNNRNDDTLDIAIIKLKPELADMMLNSGYQFLNYSQVETGVTLIRGNILLLAGYPATKTQVDYQTNKLKFSPLVVRTTPFLKDLKNISFPKEFHHIATFPRKSFQESTTRIQIAAPQPYGISGSGLWILAKDSDTNIHPILIGILSEYHENRSIVISTKIDLFIDLLKQKFDNTIENNGVTLELLNEAE